MVRAADGPPAVRLDQVDAKGRPIYAGLTWTTNDTTRPAGSDLIGATLLFSLLLHGVVILGVTFDKDRGKYMARIILNRHTRHLGRYDTVEAAGTAYITAKREMHPFGVL